MLEALLVFLILVAIIITTVVLVIIELRRLKKTLASEEVASRTNEQKLRDDLNATALSLHNTITSEDSIVITKLENGDKKLSNELSSTKSSLTKTNTDITSLSANVSNYLALGTSNLQVSAHNLNLKPASGSNYGSAKYSSSNGISIENTAAGSLSDLWVPRAHIGTSLNLGGSLSFSSAQGTYSLGVGMSNINLQLPANNEFTVTGASNASLRVNDRSTTVNSTLNVVKESTFQGGVSEHNKGKGLTHFPWYVNGRNYIRGDTEITGNTNNVGDMVVGRDLRINRNVESVGNVKVGTDLNVNGSANFKGGVSEHNNGNGQTHFPWSGNGRNYIRGDTEITGNTNNIGDMVVGRDLRINRNVEAVGNVKVGTDLNINGSANFKGGVSEHNKGNRQTHFPWSGNGRNYIRGDTEITGNTNNIGDLRVGRKFCIEDICISKSNLQSILNSAR